MATNDLFSMSLDEVISAKYNNNNSNGSGRGRGRGGNRGGRSNFRAIRRERGSGFRDSVPFQSRVQKVNVAPLSGEQKKQVLENPDVQWKHDLFPKVANDGPRRGRFNNNNSTDSIEIDSSSSGSRSRGFKIRVTNLNYSVSEQDLIDLFSEIGAVKHVFIKYDKAGRSEGTADVSFESKDEAERAANKYDGVELDKKPMKIMVLESNFEQRSVPSRGFGSFRNERRRGTRSSGFGAGRRSNPRVRVSSRGRRVGLH